MNFIQRSPERPSFNHVLVLGLPALLFVLSLVVPSPVFADSLAINPAECAGASTTVGHASVSCVAAQTPFYSASYNASGTLGGPVIGNNVPGTFGVEATVIQLPCTPLPPFGCGRAVSTALTATYVFGGLGVSSGMAQFDLTARGSISGPPGAGAEFEVNPDETLIVNGVPIVGSTVGLVSGTTVLAVDAPIVNGSGSLQFTLLASAVCGGTDGCVSDVNFLDPLTITGASAFDSNGVLVPDVNFVSESGFNPNAGGPVPTSEPFSMMLLGAGLLGLVGLSLKKAKPLIQVFGLVLAIALFAPSSKADTVYSYVGNPFNLFAPTAACPPDCKITGSFTVSAPLLASSSYFITPLSFSFTDGNVTFTQANVTFSSFGFITDAQGLITGWNLNWFNANEAMFSATGTSVICQVGCFFTDVILTLPKDFIAGNQNDPGTWTSVTTGVPEPSSLSLLCIAMLGLIAFSLKKAVA